MVYRSFIRKLIATHLLKATSDETEDKFGHAECLEIMASIIQGLAVPLKSEHA